MNWKKSDKLIKEELERCPWPDAVERLYDAIENNKVHLISANDYYTFMKATGGSICLGWYQPSLSRFASFIVFIPGDGLYGITDDLKYKTGIPEISKDIRDNDKVKAYPMHISIAKDKHNFNNEIKTMMGNVTEHETITKYE